MSVKEFLGRLAKGIDQLNAFFGKGVSWLSFALVIIICIDVTLRYLLNMTRIWVIELETYAFSLLFLLGGAWTWQTDDHVRVDVFYTKLSPKGKRWIDLIGTLLFLFPWTWILMQVGLQFFWESWKIGEGSSQPGGLPAIYIIKFFMLLGFILLFLQGLSHCIQLILNWNKNEDE
jgi:TRAP-type mannitol/chloroaromatic compound transport system permease small subunit